VWQVNDNVGDKDHNDPAAAEDGSGSGEPPVGDEEHPYGAAEDPLERSSDRATQPLMHTEERDKERYGATDLPSVIE
jgi:hypothetical protein